MKRYLVKIDFSQTDATYVMVEGADSKEEAVQAVKDTTNCPRVYYDGPVDRVLKLNKTEKE